VNAPARTLDARLRATLELVKLAHTVFALPFALLAAFVAASGPPPLRTTLLILAAMVAARTGAMASNRLADVRFDTDNPRTARRALVTGELSRSYVLSLAVLSYLALVLCAWLLNPLAFALSPLAVALLTLYSFTKRFTWMSHAALGLALAGAPLGAWIAVTGGVAPAPFILGAAVLLWVTGFDIIYACQDIEFDRRHRLHSIPVRFGLARALRISTALHGAMILLLLALPWMSPLGPVFFAGTLVIGGLLAYEHRLVTVRSLDRVNEAFFTVNGVVSVVLLVVGVADLTLFG